MSLHKRKAIFRGSSATDMTPKPRVEYDGKVKAKSAGHMTKPDYDSHVPFQKVGKRPFADVRKSPINPLDRFTVGNSSQDFR